MDIIHSLVEHRFKNLMHGYLPSLKSRQKRAWATRNIKYEKKEQQQLKSNI